MAECLQDARVWPHDSDGPIFGSGVVFDGVVFDGHTRGYAPTVGTRPIHVMFMQSDGGGIRRAYTGVCPYGGNAPDSCHVHAIRFPTHWIFTYILPDKLQFLFIAYNMIIIAGLP